MCLMLVLYCLQRKRKRLRTRREIRFSKKENDYLRFFQTSKQGLLMDCETNVRGILQLKSFTTDNLGKALIIHLTKGDLLLENIQAEVQRLGIRTGVIVSGIGSLRKLVIHYIASTNDDPDNEYLTIEAPLEIGSLQGIIVEGVPHLHIVCSDPDRAYIGHLEDGSEVQYLAEIMAFEVKDLDLIRKTDEFGIGYFDVE